MNGNTRIHQGQRGTTHRTHGGRASRREYIRDRADCIRELVLRRKYRRYGALRQSTMPNLTTTRTAQRLTLTSGEMWEVVMVHKALIFAAPQTIQHLLITRRAKRHYTQHLRLSTREESRTMSTW